MRIPKELKIGAHMFTVELTSKEDMGNPSPSEMERGIAIGKHWTYFGDMHPGELKIRINKDVEPSMMKETLLHEVLHAVVELTGVRNGFKLGREEHIVQAMAHLLTEVFLENPKFAKMFTNTKK